MDLVKGYRIDFTFHSLSERKVLSCKEMHLTLFERRIEYKIIGVYECPDDDTAIMAEKKANYRWCKSRSDIANVIMNYCNAEKLWVVELEFHGVNDDLGLHFDDPKECLKVYDLLKNYFYP